MPPQEGQSVPEGIDPAALVAARKEAVARNRRQAARISLLQDVLRVIGILVLIAGVAWFSHMRHQQHMEEERQKAEHERAVQIAREKEREAEAARQEARRKAQMEAKRAAEEATRRREEQKAEALRVQQANIKRYQTALARFKGAVLDLLAAAPPSDLPAKVEHETWFSCLVPGGRAGSMLYEIFASPGQSLRVSRLDAEGKVEDVVFEEFNRQVAKSPYLLSKGSYCYYNPAHARRWELRVPVLADGETLDPSREDFRDLYDIVRRMSLVTSSFAYDVFFRDFGGGETRLFSVPFGGTVTRSAVQRSLQSMAGSQRRQRDDDLRSRMEQGSLIIRRRGARR